MRKLRSPGVGKDGDMVMGLDDAHTSSGIVSNGKNRKGEVNRGDSR